MMNNALKSMRYALEAVFLVLLLGLFKCMPARAASNIGGAIGRTLGPRLATSRKALRNLKRALPELDEARKDEIIKGMWDNLGRIIAEYPHLKTLARHTQINGTDALEAALKNQKGAVFFGAHFGNWEINAPAILMQYNKAIDVSYRAANNPWVDALLMKTRAMGGQIEAHSKSRRGGKNMIDAIKNGGFLGILIDQKYNEGLAVPFFGIEAMTNPFFVQLAQKYNCPLIPIRNKRLNGARFTLSVYEPIPVFDELGATRPVEDVIKDAHSLLERFIEDAPEQWLWLHRRWKD